MTLSYTPTPWGPGSPVISTGRLQNAEDGIDAIYDVLNGSADFGPITFAPPIVAPASGASATATAGTTMGIGAYGYALTYVTGVIKTDGTLVVSGETIASPTWAVTTTSGNQKTSITGLPSGGVTVIGKRLYRTVVGGAQLKLVTTLTNGTATYTDSLADASLGANVPTSNTTGTTLTLGNGHVVDDEVVHRIMSY